MGNPFAQSGVALTGPLSGIAAYWVEGRDRLRIKPFASIANMEFKVVVKFIRADEAASGKVRTWTKILYPNSGRGSGLPPLSGLGSFPFAAQQDWTRTVNDAGITASGTTLTSATAAFVAGDVSKQITIAGAGLAGSSGPNTPTSLYHGQIASVTNGTTAEVTPAALSTVSNAQLIIEPPIIADDGTGEAGPCWVIAVNCNFWRSVPKRGQCYTEVEINRGDFNMHEGAPLIKAYLGGSEHTGWPYGVVEAKASGKGGMVLTTIAAPGTGAEWTHTVPTNCRQQPISLRWTLTTNATVANRQVIVIIDDGTNIFWSGTAPAVQAASLTHAYILSTAPRLDSIAPPVGAVQQHIPLPTGLEISENFRIRLATANFQTGGGGDAESAVQALMQEWIEE